MATENSLAYRCPSHADSCGSCMLRTNGTRMAYNGREGLWAIILRWLAKCNMHSHLRKDPETLAREADWEHPNSPAGRWSNLIPCGPFLLIGSSTAVAGSSLVLPTLISFDR